MSNIKTQNKKYFVRQKKLLHVYGYRKIFDRNPYIVLYDTVHAWSGNTGFISKLHPFTRVTGFKLSTTSKRVVDLAEFAIFNLFCKSFHPPLYRKEFNLSLIGQKELILRFFFS